MKPILLCCLFCSLVCFVLPYSVNQNDFNYNTFMQYYRRFIEEQGTGRQDRERNNFYPRRPFIQRSANQRREIEKEKLLEEESPEEVEEKPSEDISIGETVSSEEDVSAGEEQPTGETKKTPLRPIAVFSPKDSCGSIVSKSIQQIINCTYHRAEDIRLGAQRSVFYGNTIVQLNNGWLGGIWNLRREEQQNESATCDDGDRYLNVSTTVSVPNAFIRYNWRRFDNIDDNSATNNASCAPVIFSQGYAVIKNSKIKIQLTFADDDIGAKGGIKVKEAKVLEVGNYVSNIIEHKPQLQLCKAPLVHSWIETKAIKCIFEKAVMIEVNNAINECIPEFIKPNYF